VCNSMRRNSVHYTAEQRRALLLTPYELMHSPPPLRRTDNFAGRGGRICPRPPHFQPEAGL